MTRRAERHRKCICGFIYKGKCILSAYTSLGDAFDFRYYQIACILTMRVTCMPETRN